MGRSRLFLFIYSYENMYGGPTMCLALCWTQKNVPTPLTPTPPVTQHSVYPTRLPTGSPNPLGVTGPSVLGCQVLPPPPSETSWPNDRLARPPREQTGWVLIPRPPPPGQAQTVLAQWWPVSPPGSMPSQQPAGPRWLCDLEGEGHIPEITTPRRYHPSTTTCMATSICPRLPGNKN